MTDLEGLHNEKLEAHSRENEQCEVCDDCEMNYPECTYDPQDCQQAADEERAENNFEGMRDAYD